LTELLSNLNLEANFVLDFFYFVFELERIFRKISIVLDVVVVESYVGVEFKVGVGFLGIMKVHHRYSILTLKNLELYSILVDILQVYN